MCFFITSDAAIKAFLPEKFLIFFNDLEHPKLYKSDIGPSSPVSPSRNIMFGLSLERIYSPYSLAVPFSVAGGI